MDDCPFEALHHLLGLDKTGLYAAIQAFRSRVRDVMPGYSQGTAEHGDLFVLPVRGFWDQVAGDSRDLRWQEGGLRARSRLTGEWGITGRRWNYGVSQCWPAIVAWRGGVYCHRGWLYVAYSFLGLVWRVHSDGQSPAEVWSDHPLLQHPSGPPSGLPGPNGLQIFQKKVYVSVSSRTHLVAIPIKRDRSAGLARVHVELGFDDFAFDVQGNLYGTTNFVSNAVVRVTPNGRTKTLLTADDGLDGPSAAAFGLGNDENILYITNAAFPFAPGPEPRRPSLMRLRIGIPGKPRP